MAGLASNAAGGEHQGGSPGAGRLPGRRSRPHLPVCTRRLNPRTGAGSPEPESAGRPAQPATVCRQERRYRRFSGGAKLANRAFPRPLQVAIGAGDGSLRNRCGARAVMSRALPGSAVGFAAVNGYPAYRLPLEKRRLGPGRYHQTRNVTDDGAASPERLITQAVQTTRFAGAIVEELAPDRACSSEVSCCVSWRADPAPGGAPWPSCFLLVRHPSLLLPMLPRAGRLAWCRGVLPGSRRYRSS